jgi:hypothetical protein
MLAEGAIAAVIAVAEMLDAADGSLSDRAPRPAPEVRIVPRV